MIGGRPPRDEQSQGAEQTERFAVDDPSPWYLRRWVLALWGSAVLVLIAIIVYGLTILSRDNGGGTPAPTMPRTSTTTSSSTSSPPASTPAVTTTTDESATPTPSPTATGAPQHPRRHWWRSNMPPMPHF